MENKKTAADLDILYEKSIQVDDAIFSEMRSNVLLVSGEHYNKANSKSFERIRDSKGIPEGQKLRLTKNHTAKICESYAENILSQAPNTMIVPRNEGEIQNQKAAELNNSVWEYYKDVHNIRAKVRKLAKDYIDLGEAWVKIFWDESKGKLVGYEPLINEDGEPVMKTNYTESGDIYEEPVLDESKPIMSGDFIFERIFAFNVFRHPTSQDIFDSPFIGIRKMVEKPIIKKMVGDPEKWKTIVDETEETYLVFDGESAKFDHEKDKIMVREFYYKPCMEYPNGYYYISVRGHILAEGEIPFGIFPIIGAGFDEIQTSARYRSPVKRIRPYQIEINRAASGMATAQVTLGDDKLILSHGSKITEGAKVAGVRAISVAGGADPKVLAGRSGEQYLGYMINQIDELYTVMNANEIEEDKGLDPYALLYKSVKNKAKFRKYVEQFEDFLVKITKVFLQLAKEYLDENTLIPMVGRAEMVNISEFLNTKEFDFSVSVKGIGLDADTLLGKQLAVNHTLQYVGGSLDKNDIGKLLRSTKYFNEEELFGDLTQDYDVSKNNHLSIERGELPLINEFDNHTYLIKKATSRMAKPDYRYLADEIKSLYEEYLNGHMEMEAEQVLKAQRLKEGFIPIDGPMLNVDYYITDDNGRTKRAKIPSSALFWLEQQLTSQGTPLEKLEGMTQEQLARISVNMEQQQGNEEAPQDMQPQNY